MRSSSKLDGIMKLSWRRPCRTPLNRNMADQANLSTDILDLRRPWVILKAHRLTLSGTSAHAPKVGLVNENLNMCA